MNWINSNTDDTDEYISPYPYMGKCSSPKGSHRLTRVTMYRPFSKSYTVFSWGLLHLNTDHAAKISRAEKARTERTTNEFFWNREIQSECSSLRFDILCMMNAPKAQSSWKLPTRFINESLLKEEMKGMLRVWRWLKWVHCNSDNLQHTTRLFIVQIYLMYSSNNTCHDLFSWQVLSSISSRYIGLKIPSKSTCIRLSSYHHPGLFPSNKVMQQLFGILQNCPNRIFMIRCSPKFLLSILMGWYKVPV